MKYIVFESPQGPRVVIFAAPTLHVEEEARHAAWRPCSAGFIEFLGQGRVRCFGRSDGLNLGPALRDESLIEVMMNATLRLCAQPPA